MLKPVSPNSHLLYHTFLLGLKKKKITLSLFHVRLAGEILHWDLRRGHWALGGLCWLSPVHPSSPCLPQVSTGGQGDPAGHSSLTCALHEEGCDQLVWQQPYFHCKSRIPRGTSDCGCLCRASAGRSLWTKCKAPESPFQPFHPGKRNQGGKGSPVLLPFPGFTAGGQKRTTQPCEMFGVCLCTQHSALEVRPNGGLKGFQMCQTNIKI